MTQSLNDESRKHIEQVAGESLAQLESIAETAKSKLHDGRTLGSNALASINTMTSSSAILRLDQISQANRESYQVLAVLNARFDAEEAAIVARAGEPGQVTVATNMAGRGTDIPLAPGVAAAGGLHVMCCQFNASRRIDRQLEGRCARQGDPGSVERWISLETPRAAGVPLLGALARRCGADEAGRLALRPGVLAMLLAWSQWRQEGRARRARRALLESDREWERGLSFGGPGE